MPGTRFPQDLIRSIDSELNLFHPCKSGIQHTAANLKRADLSCVSSVFSKGREDQKADATVVSVRSTTAWPCMPWEVNLAIRELGDSPPTQPRRDIVDSLERTDIAGQLALGEDLSSAHLRHRDPTKC